MSFLLNSLIKGRIIDPSRIGAVGFSSGAFTVAALLGAEIDPTIMTAFVDGEVPAPALPEFPDLIPTLRAKLDEDALADAVGDGTGSLADSRICAVSAIAPAIGGLVDQKSSARISRPSELRWACADDITPPGDNALVYSEAAPFAQGRCVGDEVGHYDFLSDREDPWDVRNQVAEDVAAFFRETL